MPDKFKFTAARVLSGVAIPVALFLLSWAPAATAQLDPGRLTFYDDLDGTSIYDVMPDSRGNIWIASINGLIRFDGYEYKRFHPDLNDSTTIGTLLTYSLFEDRSGNILIGGMYDVYLYNPLTETFKRTPISGLADFPELSQTSAVSFQPDNKGRIYIGIFPWDWTDGRGGLVYYDESDGQIRRFELPDDIVLNGVFALAGDLEGNVWVRARTGIYLVDTLRHIKQIQPPEGMSVDPGDWVNGLLCDRQGTLWTTFGSSVLYSYNETSKKLRKWSLQDLPGGDALKRFRVDLSFGPEGDLWMGSNHGVIRFDTVTHELDVFEENINSSRADVNCLHFDSFGNLWIGIENEGLLKYSDKAVFKSLNGNPNDEKALTTGWISTIFENSGGDICLVSPVGDKRSGFTLFDPVTGSLEPFPYSEVLPDVANKSLLGEVEKNQFLFMTDSSYFVYDPINKVASSAEMKDLPKAGVSRIFRDEKGYTWYCTWYGLFRSGGLSGPFTRFDLSAVEGGNPMSNEVTDCRQGGNDGLWICTNNGLFRYEYATETITRHAYDPEQGDVLSSQDINSVYEDDQGIVWVGTWQGGLCRYDPEQGKIRTLYMQEGLPSSSVQGILGDDANGTLWLSTFSGISRFDKAAGKFTNYSVKDGISSQLYADGSYFRSSHGLFFFGGENGVTYFDPENLTKISDPPKTYIKDFKAGEKSLARDSYENPPGKNKPIILSHEQNNISFAYTGIQYDNPPKNSFAFILEGYEDTWREVGNIRSAYYYNLPPGKYTFRVRAANSHGVWNDEPAALSFTVRPPWWKTTWAYAGYGILLLLLVYAFDRIQRRRIRERERKTAREKELAQAREIEKAYHQLKTTQSQLVHAEKMASLGELTAGIAHEIQNPLNFINNFSEVNSELLQELRDEIKKKNTAEIEMLINEISSNEARIISHGKRADAIVKGMLQHSRSSNGRKEPTDINTLADEYLRLAYHGLRARDKSFNAGFKLETDEQLPLADVVPQDIGRVLLNLINNAFYAVAEKSKQNIEGYRPEVTVSTNRQPAADAPEGERPVIEIRVRDNGTGLPDEIREKIFQPFFTTKPSGEGTGLGLSLSYDIVTKGHGGEIRVESAEGKGTTFIVQLPVG